MSFLFFRIIFSLESISKQNKKSVAGIIFHGMCVMLKLNCNAKSQTFHKGEGIYFVWKNLVTDLLSVLIITGLVAPQNTCPNSLKTR